MKQTQLQLRDQFVELFFKGDTLQRVIAHFSNTCSAQYVDPITSTCEILLKNPLQCALNQQGVCPFKAHPTMTFPFSLMNSKQHRFLNAIQLAENRENVSTHQLMGGGRVLLFFDSAPSAYVSHTDTLVAICQATLAHPNYAAEQRLLVCNIVLQRLAALTNISNQTLKHVNEQLRERIIEIQT
jgi:hypothetical protein